MKRKTKKIILFLAIFVVAITIPLVIYAFEPVTATIALTALSKLISGLVRVATYLAKQVLTIVAKLGFVAVLSGLVLYFGNGFLNMAANPDFIPIKATQNEFVLEGWGIVRDLVNMMFILLIVVMGIGVALRVRGYEIQKTLPRLVAVILLINFAPLIIGVIIDASNIFMNFFLTSGTGGFTETLNLSTTATSNLFGIVQRAVTHPGELLDGSLAFRLIALTVFNFTAAFVLILLGLLLIIRHIALWILIILSPLAFFCFILPRTQKIWNQWWQQLVQWCFIGVGAAFFIYMSQFLEVAVSNFMTIGGGAELGLEGGLAFIIVKSIPIIFICISLIVLSSTSAEGAKQIIGLTKKGSKWAIKKKGLGIVKKHWQKARVQAIPSDVKETMARMETAAQPIKYWGKGDKGAKWLGKKAAGLAVAPIVGGAQIASKFGRWVSGGSAAEFSLGKDAYETAKKNMNTPYDVIRYTREIDVSPIQKANYLKVAEEKGLLKAALDKSKVGASALSSKEISAIYRKTREMNMKDLYETLEMRLFHNNEIRKSFQGVGAELGEDLEKFVSRIAKNMGKKVNLEKLDIDKIMANPEAKENLIKFAMRFDNHQLGEASKVLGREFVDEVDDRAAKLLNQVDDAGNKLDPPWFFRINPKTGKMNNPHYARHAASNTSVFSPLRGYETKEKIAEATRAGHEWELKITRAQAPSLGRQEKIDNLNILITEAQTVGRGDIEEAAKYALDQIYLENPPKKTKAKKRKVKGSSGYRKKKGPRGTKMP